MKYFLIVLIFVIATAASAEVQPPQGKFLFQPMLVWGNSDVTHQGTGYLIEDPEGRVFGVTSIHFLEFDETGLFEAIWLDIPEYVTVCGFRNSLGRPLVREIDQDEDIQRDFIILSPDGQCFDGYTKLSLDDRKRLETGEKLWFPDKNFDLEIGYKLISAKVTEDGGSFIEIKLDSPIVMESQSGSPVFSQENGKVVGMVFGGEEQDGDIVIWLCPARNIHRFLQSKRDPVPLMNSVR